MSTPPYVAPSVGPAGLVVSGYQSILADNLQGFLNIYGQNQYIGPDSAIYQLIAIISLKQAHTNAALQLEYNQSSPKTAVGAGLDRVLAMNGLAREELSFSTAQLTVTGAPGAVLTNAFAQDQNGNLWALPSPTTITGGTVIVTGTCTTPGNVTAQPGTINIVATPQTGWTPPTGTVTNAASAIAGVPVETDSQARARQAISVALPSTTPIAATIAAILAIDGVTRIAPGFQTPDGPGTSIENPTGAVDFWGNPPHSISLVVEGGTDQAVANTIYAKKTIGCLTNGTTSVSVVDPVTGFTEIMSFYRPTYVPIYVRIVVHGYSGTPTSAVLAAIQLAVTTYLNELSIGETVSMAAVIYEVMALNATLFAPNFGVQSLAMASAQASTTATTTISSNVIVVASAAGIVVGQIASLAGVPSGTTVTVISGTNITLSNPATVNGTAVPVYFFGAPAASDIPMPTYFSVALGALPNVYVTTE